MVIQKVAAYCKHLVHVTCDKCHSCLLTHFCLIISLLKDWSLTWLCIFFKTYILTNNTYILLWSYSHILHKSTNMFVCSVAQSMLDLYAVQLIFFLIIVWWHKQMCLATRARWSSLSQNVKLIHFHGSYKVLAFLKHLSILYKRCTGQSNKVTRNTLICGL